MKINKKQIILIGSAPILCGAMICLVPLLTTTLGKTYGYILSFCIYWFVFCIPITVYTLGGFGKLKAIYSLKSDMVAKRKIAYYFLAFVPCIAVFFVVFIKLIPEISAGIILIALFFALINGTIEELLWRGVYNKVFGDRVLFAFIYPTIFFSVWHIGLYFARGIQYQGGFASLVGGAAFMGCLWGWIAFRTKSIKIVSIAHIVVNFFAFTALILENWG